MTTTQYKVLLYAKYRSLSKYICQVMSSESHIIYSRYHYFYVGLWAKGPIIQRIDIKNSQYDWI